MTRWRRSLIGMVMVTLVGGLGGTAMAQSEEGDVVAFPTGMFVAAEWSDRYVAFNDDGTCLWAFNDYQDMGCTYLVEGEFYTQTSVDENWVGPEGFEPATYRWEYDGDLLTFSDVSDDPHTGRRATHTEQPYRFVPDPRLVVVAGFDIAAGTELLAGHTDRQLVSGATVPDDALADKDMVTGRIASVAISEGQPITPDLLGAPE